LLPKIATYLSTQLFYQVKHLPEVASPLSSIYPNGKAHPIKYLIGKESNTHLYIFTKGVHPLDIKIDCNQLTFMIVNSHTGNLFKTSQHPFQICCYLSIIFQEKQHVISIFQTHHTPEKIFGHIPLIIPVEHPLINILENTSTKKLKRPVDRVLWVYFMGISTVCPRSGKPGLLIVGDVACGPSGGPVAVDPEG
jgi:hypothetical protein